MIDLSGMISIPFLKKSRFTGSYQGMRYLLCREERTGEEGAQEPVITAVIWPEPFNYERTPEEKKHRRQFPFDKDGLLEAVGWLNEEHEVGHY